MAYWVVPLLAAAANVFLAFFVARAASRSDQSRAFIFLSIMFVFWNMSFFSLYFFDDYERASYASKVFRIGTAFMPAAAVHLVASLRRRTASAWPWLLGLNYLVAVGLTVANIFDYFVVGLQRFEGGFFSVAGPAYDVFTVYLLTNVALALVVLVYDYRSVPDARVRLQLRFWLLGALVAIPLGCTNLLPAYGVPIYPLGNLGNTFWAAVVAYALARHRLMDIDVIVIKGAAFAISAFLVVVPVFILLLWGQSAIFGFIDRDVSLLILVALFLVAVIFPRVLIRIEPGLYASLFPEKREYRQALVSFTHSITRILDKEMLIRELASSLSRNLGLDSVLVALAEGRAARISPTYVLGRAPTSLGFTSDKDFHGLLYEAPGPLLVSEIRERGSNGSCPGVVREFDTNEWEVCIPLRVGPRLLGFIALGSRVGFDAFSSQDLEILDTLGAEASIALENSRLYAELQQSQDMIRRADRSSAMGVLAAGIAHEIRNPLVSIQTFFQLAPHRLHDEEFVTTFLETAAGEVRRISQLIDELLSFARSPTTEFGPTNLAEVVQGAFVLLAPEARKHRLTLEHVVENDLSPVWGNFEQIRQVLINLLFNAIQATGPNGQVTVTVGNIQIDGLPFGQIEVRDTGIGIPAEQIECLFDPFFTTKPAGTGLGLAIVQRIVEEHQGRIRVASEIGKGTCFYVEIPTQAAAMPADAVALEM